MSHLGGQMLHGDQKMEHLRSEMSHFLGRHGAGMSRDVQRRSQFFQRLLKFLNGMSGNVPLSRDFLLFCHRSRSKSRWCNRNSADDGSGRIGGLVSGPLRTSIILRRLRLLIASSGRGQGA